MGQAARARVVAGAGGGRKKKVTRHTHAPLTATSAVEVDDAVRRAPFDVLCDAFSDPQQVPRFLLPQAQVGPECRIVKLDLKGQAAAPEDERGGR